MIQKTFLLQTSNTSLFNRSPNAYKVKWRREIVSINGNKITLNAPIVHAIEAVYGGAIVYHYTFPQEIQNVGIENMRIESIYASETDENHGRSAVKFQRVTNAWMRQVTAKYFWHGAVSLISHSMYVTVEDSAMLEHKGVVTGGRRYSFYADDSDFLLFQRLLTKSGRHDFVSGSRTPGPNVWVDGLAMEATSDCGPHHRLSTGQIYDNIRVEWSGGGPGMAFAQNRESSGSGHGWAGSEILFWNTEAKIINEAPNGGMNFAIGNVGIYVAAKDGEPDGIWQSENTHVTPRSLYYTQLSERQGKNALSTQLVPMQRKGPIWTDLKAWNGDGLFMDSIVLWYDEDSGTPTPAKYISIHGMVRNLNLLEGAPSYQWKTLSGPGKATFVDSTSPIAAVSFDAAGMYELELTVTNGQQKASATMSVVVTGSSTLPNPEPKLAPSQPPTSATPAPVPTAAPAPVGTCTKNDFLKECSMTSQCKSKYGNTAFDCKNSEGGVCFCGTGEVCGCNKANGWNLRRGLAHDG